NSGELRSDFQRRARRETPDPVPPRPPVSRLPEQLLFRLSARRISLCPVTYWTPKLDTKLSIARELISPRKWNHFLGDHFPGDNYLVESPPNSRLNFCPYIGKLRRRVKAFAILWFFLGLRCTKFTGH